MSGPLPIEAVFDQITSAMDVHGQLVLQAPPGAGKTTLVPLHLLRSGLVEGRILMLEPRRVAARSAAKHMASLLGESVGTRVGYRMRGESKTSKETRIEVVTEGVLTRMINTDPELSGVGCVIFDEFHERSLQADLGLALSLEIREGLREDLKIIVMSATLDAEPVARLMGGAPVVTSEGRNFAVETIHLDVPWNRPGQRGPRFEASMADLITKAVAENSGSVLVFLPGAGEIRRVQGALSLGDGIDVLPLFGGLPFAQQLAALEPAPKGRRHVVLATAIAETSLTIPDIKVVVDGGRSRRPRFDPGSGMTRLVTDRVSKAEAVQRRGRAGRVSEGVCYRHWTKGEEGGLASYPPVEIEDNDLLGLVLDLATWGVVDPSEMPFLTPPPMGAFREAQVLLSQFGALDGAGAITKRGRAIAKMPLHPRLASMVVVGIEEGMGRTAPLLAALLEERGQFCDVERDLKEALRRGLSKDAKAMIKRLPSGSDTGDLSLGGILSLAFPDRIAKRRKGTAPRYLMSGGKGAIVGDQEDLGGSDWLAIAELDGDAREAKVRRAARISLEEILSLHETVTETVCHWDKRSQAVVSEVQTKLGAIVLDSETAKGDPEAVVQAMIQGVRLIGLSHLSWGKGTRSLVDRAIWARAHGSDIADMSQSALLEDLEGWLAPFLDGVVSKSGLSGVDLKSALEARLGWGALEDLDALAPVKFKAPTGSQVEVDYSGDLPKVSIRLQEMMGTTQHPTVGKSRTPLLMELLSPGHRPIQTTSDLPGFWSTSYADVRKDMRGRYPKHHWPENPAEAEATRRVKHPKRGR